MFTIDQIKAAHAKVKSGADFPEYIRDIIGLGVTKFETYVHDNRTNYYSDRGMEESSAGDLKPLTVSSFANDDRFRRRLADHQQGKTDFQTFRQDCADAGINKWIVEMNQMACTYYDLSGRTVLVESIPA